MFGGAVQKEDPLVDKKVPAPRQANLAGQLTAQYPDSTNAIGTQASASTQGYANPCALQAKPTPSKSESNDPKTLFPRG
eukprot:4384953-Amphidinium_carterae.2